MPTRWLTWASLRRSGFAAKAGQPPPRALFQMPILVTEGRVLMPTANNYLAAPNGERFLAAVSAPDPNLPPISIVVNWPAVVNRGHSR